MQLQSGPLEGQRLFVRNVQPHPDRNDMWIVEAQGGEKGKGKVWRPTIVVRNPLYDPKNQSWDTRHEFVDCAEVKPCLKSHRRGQFEARIWWHPGHRWVEGYFPTEQEAIAFMIHTAGRYAHVPV